MNFCFSICILVALFVSVHGEGTKVGSFVNHHHGIAGTVYAKDRSTLVITGFTYDGAGPDAFFWAGTQGQPSGNGEILPYPFQGKFYGNDDRSAPIISGTFNGDKTITLTLPEKLKVTDLMWLSVWCRAFSVNFGDLIFPQNFALGDGGNLNDNPENNLDTSNANGTKKDDLMPPLLSDLDNDITNIQNIPKDDSDTAAFPNNKTDAKHVPELTAVSNGTGLPIGTNANSKPGTKHATEPAAGSNRTEVALATNIMAILVLAFYCIMLYT